MRRWGRATTVIVTSVGVLFTARPAGATDIPGAGTIANLITSPFGWAWDKVASGITSWVLSGIGDLITNVVGALARTTTVDLSAVWFAGPGSPYAVVRQVAVGLATLLVFAGLLQGLLRGEPGFMLRQVGVGVPLAVLGTVMSTWMVGHLLALTDVLAGSVLASQQGEAGRFLTGFGTAAVGFTGGFAVVLIGLVAELAALLLWVELIVRAALVYLLVAMLPLAFAATVWPAARGVLRRSVELLIAVVISKLVVAIALAVGVAALGGAGGIDGAPGGGLATLLSGTVILGLAAFAPFLVMKLMPAVEAAVIAHGISRMPVRSMERAAGLVMTGASVARLAGTTTAALRAGSTSAGQQPSSGATHRLASGTTEPASQGSAPTGREVATKLADRPVTKTDTTGGGR